MKTVIRYRVTADWRRRRREKEGEMGEDRGKTGGEDRGKTGGEEREKTGGEKRGKRGGKEGEKERIH